MSISAQRIVTSHKEAAERATQYLARARNLKLKKGEALELVAHVLGVANWQTLHAMALQGRAPRLEGGADVSVQEAGVGESPASSAPDVAVRLERYYTAQGFREHPIFGREDWVNSVDDEVMDDDSYWSWVARRLGYVKALLPWERDGVYCIQVCRAAGVDVDFDPNPELWVVASSERDDFLDVEGESSELALWTKLAAMAEERAKRLPDVTETFWDCASLALRLALVKKCFAVQPRTQPAQALIPREFLAGRPVTRPALMANGFEPRASADGEVLVKRMKAWDMPYFREHVIKVGERNSNFRTEGVYEDSIAEIIITPDWKVQLCVGDEYREEHVLVDSDEGRAVLRDAGFQC